jgi:acetyltransferase
MTPVGLGIQTGPAGERLLFREATPADEPVAHAAFHTLSEETRHNRFMAAVNEIPEDILTALRHPDPARQLMVACFRVDDAGREVEPVGAARMVHSVDDRDADFGMVITDAWQRRGVGARLLGILIANARARGLRQLRGHVLATNDGMLALARYLGFDAADSLDEGSRVRVITHSLRSRQ